jgi:hypothetical protein
MYFPDTLTLKLFRSEKFHNFSLSILITQLMGSIFKKEDFSHHFLSHIWVTLKCATAFQKKNRKISTSVQFAEMLKCTKRYSSHNLKVKIHLNITNEKRLNVHVEAQVSSGWLLTSDWQLARRPASFFQLLGWDWHWAHEEAAASP